MHLKVPDKCPTCGLILLHGAIFDAVDKADQYGPILGLNRGAKPDSAQAGYVGLGSLYDPEHLRPLYRCPRCGSDPLVEDQP
jgi:hypothetical protein